MEVSAARELERISARGMGIYPSRQVIDCLILWLLFSRTRAGRVDILTATRRKLRTMSITHREEDNGHGLDCVLTAPLPTYVLG